MWFTVQQKLQKQTKISKKPLNFKDIKFPVKVRDTQKVEKNSSISISVFGYEKKVKYPITVSK